MCPVERSNVNSSRGSFSYELNSAEDIVDIWDRKLDFVDPPEDGLFQSVKNFFTSRIGLEEFGITMRRYINRLKHSLQSLITWCCWVVDKFIKCTDVAQMRNERRFPTNLYRPPDIRQARMIVTESYPKNSAGAIMMEVWNNVYKEFKSSATQTLLREVTDTYGERPVFEVVNELVETFNSFWKYAEKYDMGVVRKLRGGNSLVGDQYQPVLMDGILVLHQEIMRCLKAESNPSERHIGARLLSQTSVLAHNLVKLMYATECEKIEMAKNYTVAILLQAMTVTVYFPSGYGADYGAKSQLGIEALTYLSDLSDSFRLENLSGQAEDTCLLALNAFFNCNAMANLLSKDPAKAEYKKINSEVGVVIASRSRAVKRSGSEDSARKQVFGIFLLNELARSETFCEDQNAIDPERVADSAEHVISVLQTGVGFEELEEEYFAQPGFAENFMLLIGPFLLSKKVGIPV